MYNRTFPYRKTNYRRNFTPYKKSYGNYNRQPYNKGKYIKKNYIPRNLGAPSTSSGKPLILSSDMTFSIRHLLSRNIIIPTHVPGIAWSNTYQDIWSSAQQQLSTSDKLTFQTYTAHQIILKQYDDVYLSKVQINFMVACDAMVPISIIRLDMPQQALPEWISGAGGVPYFSNANLETHKNRKFQKNIFYVGTAKSDKPVTYSVQHKFDERWLFNQRLSQALPALINQDPKKALINDLIVMYAQAPTNISEYAAILAKTKQQFVTIKVKYHYLVKGLNNYAQSSS